MSSTIVGPFPTRYSPGRTCTAISSQEVVGIDFATSCLPRNFDPAPTAYYSPGTACPSGYTAQESCTRSSGRGGSAQQTTVTCCPRRNGIVMSCVEDPESLAGPWESMFCTWSAGDTQTVLLVTSDVSGTDTTTAVTMTGGDGINAFGLRMIYAASDIATTAETTRTGATNQPTQTSSGGGGNNGGMGTGGIVAIAVVIPVVVIAALIGAFFWWRRRKHRSAALSPDDPHAPKELPPDSVVRSELYGSDHAPPQELPSDMAFVSELPGDSPMRATASVSSPGLSKAGGVSPAMSSAAPTNNETSPALSHSAVSREDGSSQAGGNTGPQS
ncbi:hypothetical protein ACJ41O_008679 [Fusarium nematophilum]